MKYKTLQARFTLVKFGVQKREKENLHPFDIPLLLVISWNTESKPA